MELYISSKGLMEVGLRPLYSFACCYSPNQRKKFLTTRWNPSILSRPAQCKSSFLVRVSNKPLDFIPGNGIDWEDDGSEPVEVIGIGSRTDAVFDFCSHSPFLCPTLRFWNLINEDLTKTQLHRLTGKDDLPAFVEISSGRELCSKAVILVINHGRRFFGELLSKDVATAAYASDHIRLFDLLNRVKSANGLAVGIIIKPFSFEGQRRQEEVKDLLEKLQEHTAFCIGIDTDVLLEKDSVTLDEALKTANTAVLMAINAVSVLISKSEKKIVISPQDNMNELEVSKIVKILEGYNQAEIGFGAGYNIKTSTMRAIYDCPFLSAGLKDLDGIVIGILASSDDIERSEIKVFLRTLRQSTDFKGQIILSLVREPNLESNHIMTTVVTISHTRRQESLESSIFSQLSQRFPLIFNLLRRQPSESHDSKEEISTENPTVQNPMIGVMELPDSLEVSDLISADGDIEAFGNYSAEIQTLLSNKDDAVYKLSVPEANEFGFSERAPNSSSFYDLTTKGVTSYEREPLIRPFESAHNCQEDWSNDSRDTSLLDNLSIFKLPVGVKQSADLKNSLYYSDNRDRKKEVDNNIKAQRILETASLSPKTSADAAFEAVSEFFDAGSPVLKGTYESNSKREGVVSARAASMLEAERNSPKKWNPIMEMKYRGGLYKGRCQGGLPEGKGRLSLSDGSIYDGMWHSGKRSGLGTFYFCNGDFYQGSWRDDVMHGKGWLYFQTGDRWFVNFWKGKANGEGRFYSKIGEIFFGHFKDGWRHGHFLCISVDGERYLQNWDEGVLISRKQLDADVET